ncbi:unnamed protein product [Toxocara canis]|uniref:Transposase n=1 Tax=Toxocara canis TaxID=6265 RepID=A0A183UN05_TOXCA|nr:unnamed protein product [Toxocara canis]
MAMNLPVETVKRLNLVRTKLKEMEQQPSQATEKDSRIAHALQMALLNRLKAIRRPRKQLTAKRPYGKFGLNLIMPNKIRWNFSATSQSALFGLQTALVQEVLLTA